MASGGNGRGLVEQSEAEELARTLDLWASLADVDDDRPSAGEALLQAAALLRRQAHVIASLREELQQARWSERLSG